MEKKAKLAVVWKVESGKCEVAATMGLCESLKICQRANPLSSRSSLIISYMST